MKPRSKASLVAALFFSAITVTTTAAQPNPTPEAVTAAVTRVNSGHFLPDDVETIATANDVQAIPALQQQFSKTADITLKGKLASALIRLGIKDDQYWDLLVTQATAAVQSDAPSFLKFDDKGQEARGQFPQEFTTWATAHHLSLDQAMQDQLVAYPAAVMNLGIIGDSRAIPLLRRALLSANFMVQTAGAQGLAKLQDKNSIALIIEACKRAPSASADIIAVPLIYFDDPEAQSAVNQYVPKAMADGYRQAAATGQGPYGEPHFR